MELLGGSQGPNLDDARATFELLEKAPRLYLRQDDSERAGGFLRALVLNLRPQG